VIREAMRHKTMVALGRLGPVQGEQVIALAYGKGLLGTNARYPYEWRDAKDISRPAGAGAAPDMLGRSPRRSSKARSPDFDPESFRDRYEEACSRT